MMDETEEHVTVSALCELRFVDQFIYRVLGEFLREGLVMAWAVFGDEFASFVDCVLVDDAHGSKPTVWNL